MPRPPKRGICRSKDYQAALAEWRGAQARLYSYYTDHENTLLIRLASENREGNLQIAVHDAYVIQMPTVWFDADIEVFHDIDKDRFGDPISLLIDRKAGVRIVCLGVTFWENAEPLVKGTGKGIWPKCFAPVLEHYMKVWKEYKV